MCHDCYKEYGTPKIINTSTKRVVKLIRRLYVTHSTGAALHIVTDDWNLEDDHIIYCLTYLLDNAQYYTSKDFKLQKRLLTLLKRMTIEERASALAIVDEYI
jgi:hypothetical protein